MEDCCFCPSFPIPGLIFLCFEPLLSPAGCSACALLQGALLCATAFLRGLQAGLSLGWGASEGACVRGPLLSMPLPQQTALAALFMWVFITSGLVSDTLSYTRAHSAPHLDTVTSGLSECVEVGEQ